MFPLDRRVGRIRDVVKKWIGKPRTADRRGYETIVAKATGGSLERAGFTDDQIDAELARFWNGTGRTISIFCGPNAGT